MQVEITMSRLPDVTRVVSDVRQFLDNRVSPRVQRSMAAKARTIARRAAPKKTGRLRREIVIFHKRTDSRFRQTLLVSDTPYARFQEEGTRHVAPSRYLRGVLDRNEKVLADAGTRGAILAINRFNELPKRRLKRQRLTRR